MQSSIDCIIARYPL